MFPSYRQFFRLFQKLFVGAQELFALVSQLAYRLAVDVSFLLLPAKVWLSDDVSQSFVLRPVIQFILHLLTSPLFFPVLSCVALRRDGSPAKSQRVQRIEIIAVIIRDVHHQIKSGEVVGDWTPEVAEELSIPIFSEIVAPFLAGPLVVLSPFALRKIPPAAEALYYLGCFAVLLNYLWVPECPVQLAGPEALGPLPTPPSCGRHCLFKVEFRVEQAGCRRLVRHREPPRLL